MAADDFRGKQVKKSSYFNLASFLYFTTSMEANKQRKAVAANATLSSLMCFTILCTRAKMSMTSLTFCCASLVGAKICRSTHHIVILTMTCAHLQSGSIKVSPQEDWQQMMTASVDMTLGRCPLISSPT